MILMIGWEGSLKMGLGVIQMDLARTCVAPHTTLGIGALWLAFEAA